VTAAAFTSTRAWWNFREHPQRAVGLLAIAAVLAIALSVAYLLLDLRDHELEEELEQTQRLTSVLAEQSTQYFDHVDEVLRSIQERLQTPFGEQQRLDSLPVNLLLSTRIAGLRQVRSLFVAAPDGQVLNSSREIPLNGANVADRNYFLHFKERPVNELFFGTPIRNKLDGEWSFHLARPLLDNHGRLRGVVVAALEIPQIERLFSQSMLNVNHAIALYSDQRILVARLPHVDELIGESVPELMNQRSLPTFKQGLQTLQTHGPEESQVQYTLLKAGQYPIYASVQVNREHALQQWDDTILPIVLGTAVVSVFIGLAAMFLSSELKLQQRLSAALDDARTRYYHTVESVMDAIVAVDESQNIILFNPAAEKMFGYTAQAIIGQPLNLLLPEQYRANHAQHIQGFGQTGNAQRSMTRTPRLDIHGRRSDGSLFPIESTISRTRIDGKIQFTAVLRDESERRHELNEQLRELSQSLQAVREQERALLSQELHDDVGQQLTGLKLDLSWLANRLKDGREVTFDKVEAMRAALNTCISSVRRMASEMRPIALDDLGFSAALQSLCQDLSERSAMPIALDLDPRLDIDNRDMGIALYRIVQEALTNVLRHAHAHHVWVTLRRDGDDAELSVQDDGVGLTQDQPRNGIGLVSMRERVLALGGEFDIHNRTLGGTEVQIRWSLRHPTRGHGGDI
jgi:PAS domain S-box-containing protein